MGPDHDESAIRTYRTDELTPEELADHFGPEESARLLPRVLRVTDVALERLELDALLDALLARLLKAVEADTATILLCTEAKDALVVRASLGLEMERGESVVVPMGKGLAGRVAAERHALIVDDVSRIKVVRPALRRLRTMMVAPLESEVDVIGVVHVGSLTGRRFSESELHLLRMVAARVGKAIQQASLRLEQHRGQQEHRILADIGRSLAQSLEPAEVFRVLADMLASTVGDFAISYRLDEPTSLSRVAAAHRDPALREAARSLLHFGPIDMNSVHPAIEALRTGEIVLLQALPEDFYREPMTDEEQRRIFERIGTRSAIIAPLRARTRVLGVVAIGRGERRARFESSDIPLVREIADRAALALDNATLYHRADVANRAKGQFLAVMSHELRTPLTSILGFCELLGRRLEDRAEAVSEPAFDFLGRIRRNAAHLVGMIDEILTFASIEEGMARVRLAALDPCELVEEVAEALEPEAQDKGLALRVAMPSEAVEMRSDRGKLRQILFNLAGNAVKFTEGGEVTLEVELVDESVAFRIRDTGPGIGPMDRERVFEPFTQGDQSSTRTREGTGLGLPVSRRLAELLGGELELDSRPGHGSVFTLRLPRRPESASEAS